MREIYIAASGALARERDLAIVANNLANVNSPGFKKDTAIFEVQPPEVDYAALAQSADPALDLPPAQQRGDLDTYYTRMAGSVTDYSMGNLRSTERSLDLALEERDPKAGTAFFAVQTPEGEFFTRMGNFFLNSDGQLVTPDGDPALNTKGQPIVLDSEAISVAPDGTVSTADNKAAGILRVMFAENPGALTKVGHGLFSDANGQAGVRPLDPHDPVSVRQGMLEMSNVNAVEELVRMIEIQRSYAAQQTSIRTMDDMCSKVSSMLMQG